MHLNLLIFHLLRKQKHIRLSIIIIIIFHVTLSIVGLPLFILAYYTSNLSFYRQEIAFIEKLNECVNYS